MVACLSGGREHKPNIHKSHAAAQCDVNRTFLPEVGVHRMEHNLVMTTVPPLTPISIQWLDEIDSTNSELLRRVSTGLADVPQALAARQQTHGRGRAGRRWISPGPSQCAENLCLSMLLELAVPIAELAPLTLAMGVAVYRVLPQLMLKWPNDLFLAGKKVGGILVEVAKSSATRCTVVVGVGINLRMPHAIEIDQEFTDLARHGFDVSAQDLAPAIVTQFSIAAADYAANRLTNFLVELRAADALIGRELAVSDDPTTHWRGLGISERGCLLLGIGNQKRELTAGDVRVRLGP